MVSKEDFYKLWENPINALNQFYYEHYELLEAKEKIDKAIEYIKENDYHYMNEYALERFRNNLLEILGDKE